MMNLGSFFGGFEVNNYDGTNDKLDRKYLSAVRFNVGADNHQKS